MYYMIYNEGLSLYFGQSIQNIYNNNITNDIILIYTYYYYDINNL